MPILTSKEATYWLLRDINGFVSTALEALQAGDLDACGGELKDLAEFIRDQIDLIEEQEPEIDESTDPRECGFIVFEEDTPRDGAK